MVNQKPSDSVRSIDQVHNSSFSPIADLITYSPMPSATLSMIDPFIFLNHHGFQTYPPNNEGLPFGPHPHRGMETVTFIVEGDISHKDSGGHESTIEAGGVQWMTAGRGLVHAEVSSAKFKRDGGNLEILQLWINLPARYKMTEPFYKGLQKNEIPVAEAASGVRMNVISGSFAGVPGPIKSLSNIFMSTVEMEKNSAVTLDTPSSENIFLYVVRGKIESGKHVIEARQLPAFNQDGDSIAIRAVEQSLLLFGHAVPFNERIVARGPFVMNTEAEIQQAYSDYHAGKFGEIISDL